MFCRSGLCSEALIEAGFDHVIHVADAFEGDRDGCSHRRVNGWRNAGLSVADELPSEPFYRPWGAA